MRFPCFLSGIILALCLSVSVGASPPAPVHDDDAERDFAPAYLSLATGRMAGARSQRYDWPVRLRSIGHTMASYQQYGTSASEAYFHHGVDIRADAGAVVTASAGGKVVNLQNYMPGQAAYWEVAILDAEGFLWQYHHLDRRSIPKEIIDARRTGKPIAAGTVLGKVFYWGEVSFGERYHHIHVNVIGAGKEYLNLFRFLKHLNDKDAPTIGTIAIVQKGKAIDDASVSGPYTIGAEVGDRILSAKFTVPPYRMEISVDGGPPTIVWEFERLPGGASNTRFVNNFFIPAETCGNYECRRSFVDLGFRPIAAPVFPRTLGSHQLTLTVRDYEGNETAKDFIWLVEK